MGRTPPFPFGVVSPGVRSTDLAPKTDSVRFATGYEHLRARRSPCSALRALSDEKVG